ncbi:type IV secretion system DNA-binding domain-containing protein [Patescibacteria group bacterium]|nr:type IV secretion system DNA-binding domain-containing protein [Patescibacteria group bacterium]
MDDLTIIGQTTSHNKNLVFGIKKVDRRQHIYVIGKTGSGKTTLMENMVIDDILDGRGVGVIDPHGEFAERILKFVPQERAEDVVYFNPADVEHPIGFNPLERVGDEYHHLVASGLMGVFKKIWIDAWSARMEYILNNALLSLLEYPGSTLLGVMRLLTDKAYRNEVVNHLSDPVVKNFWVNEFSRYTQRFETEATAAILNKVGQFVSNPIIRRIIGQPHSTIDLRKIMDEKKIFIANLSKGRVGEDNSELLGAMLVTKLQLAAMSRVDIPEDSRQDFYLYIDEFQNFSTESFANILSEARKYRLNLVLAHQYIAQLVTGQVTKVRDAVFGNVGTIIAFRVGADDARFLEREFIPTFTESDLVNLSKYHIYIKLLIDGIASKPFSAQTLPPRPLPEHSLASEIIERSRERYSSSKDAVDEKINEELRADKEDVNDKAGRRTEQSLDILKSEVGTETDQHVHKVRKPADLGELRKLLSRSVKPMNDSGSDEASEGGVDEKKRDSGSEEV